METDIIAQLSEVQRDGVCFFCGSYADLLAVHETKVHGSNRVRQNELY